MHAAPVRCYLIRRDKRCAAQQALIARPIHRTGGHARSRKRASGKRTLPVAIRPEKFRSNKQ
jgi:hypothetical protein